MRPGRLGSLVPLLLLGVGTLWTAFLLHGWLLAAVVLRAPDAKGLWWLAYGLFPADFFLSGVVTMLFSRRWLGPAPRASIALSRAVVLASACFLFGVVAPLPIDSYIETGDMRISLSFEGLAHSCLWWLCWVAGGLAISVPGLRRRRRTGHSA